MVLKDNTILVTGATAGIGWALCERLSAMGNSVIACGRREARLNELKSRNKSISTFVCDVTDQTLRKQLIEAVIKNYPGFNVLVNNAGIQLATDLSKPLDHNLIEQEINTNLIAPMELTSLAISHLSKHSSAVINISSGLAFTPIATMPVYCATKAAVHSWSMSLRKQLEQTSIKVYEIAPPSVDTELGHQRREDKTTTHGGMDVSNFIEATINALESDTYLAGIGAAAKMVEERDSFFRTLNAR